MADEPKNTPAGDAPAVEKPAPRPAAAKPAAAAAGNDAKLAGRTTTAAARPAPKPKAKVDDDTSPLMGRRGWMGLAWGAFTAASAG